MIGCEMGSLPTRVYISATTSPVKNFKHGWKNDVVVNMEIFFAGEILRKLGFLGNFKYMTPKSVSCSKLLLLTKKLPAI
jgi:hypothetical protein